LDILKPINQALSLDIQDKQDEIRDILQQHYSETTGINTELLNQVEAANQEHEDIKKKLNSILNEEKFEQTRKADSLSKNLADLKAHVTILRAKSQNNYQNMEQYKTLYFDKALEIDPNIFAFYQDFTQHLSFKNNLIISGLNFIIDHYSGLNNH